MPFVEHMFLIGYTAIRPKRTIIRHQRHGNRSTRVSAVAGRRVFEPRSRIVADQHRLPRADYESVK